MIFLFIFAPDFLFPFPFCLGVVDDLLLLFVLRVSFLFPPFFFVTFFPFSFKLCASPTYLTPLPLSHIFL